VVATSDIRGSGTDNAVYFDVGPWAWKLNKPFHNDFERGRTDRFSLKVPAGFALRDILWLRLHKKGLLGVTGTRDGFTGAWHPKSITLLVNGTVYASSEVSTPLNSHYWFWTNLSGLDRYAEPASFARSLRLKPNEKLSWIARATGFVTTPLFKKRGISGWLKCPEEQEDLSSVKSCSRVPPRVCATGKVFRSPAISNDGFATIDLSLTVLEFCSEPESCSKRVELNDPRDPIGRRYLRVEYRHRKNRVPKKDEQVRICGRLLWDTDREGWWEIHPRDPNDVQPAF
jgi:hypothetical protein